MKIRTKADVYLINEIENILDYGTWDENPRPKYKDGEPARTKFLTHQFRQYDLSEGEFPICTLRPMAWKSAIKEMFWIFQMKSNKLEDLHKLGVYYWDDWDVGDGTIGYRYGHTVNRYDLFKKRVLDDIKDNPYSRYHVCNLWQEQEFEDEENGLKPCAYETIWTVRGEYLDMFLNQRSGDLLAASSGGGINEIQYAALLMMVARHTGYKPGKFTHNVVNEQIYDRHFEQAKELVRRYETRCDEEFKMYYHSKDIKKELEYWAEIREKSTPHLILNPEKTNFYDFTIEDFTLENYEPDTPNLVLPLGI